MVNIIDSTDFTGNTLADFGQTVERVPITRTYTGNGDLIATEGTPENITAVILRRKPQDIQMESGLMVTSTAYIMVNPSTTLNRDDIIIYNGNRFRVLRPLTRKSPADIDIYKYADLEEQGTD